MKLLDNDVSHGACMMKEIQVQRCITIWDFMIRALVVEMKTMMM